MDATKCQEVMGMHPQNSERFIVLLSLFRQLEHVDNVVIVRSGLLILHVFVSFCLV